jgi:hypothetical protein
MHFHSFSQVTPARDRTKVALIKGLTIQDNAYVLTGKCSKCKTQYMADHEKGGRGLKKEDFHQSLFKFSQIP